MDKKELFLKLLEIQIIKSYLDGSHAIRLYEKASEIPIHKIPEDVTSAMYDYYDYYTTINHYGKTPPEWTK